MSTIAVPSAGKPALAPRAALPSTRLRVYSRSDAMWLLVPACLEPSQDALHGYGPLAYAGSFTPDSLSARELELVLLQFDAASYARIPAKTARRLLGHMRWTRVLRALRRLLD